MRIAALIIALLPALAFASGGGHLEHVPNDLHDNDSLKRGAKLFVDNCLNCHSAKYMRYQRMADDLGLSEDELRTDYMFTTDKPGNPMTVAINPADAKQWFGVTPPDLSLVSRSRGTDWLYTYLLSFYEDPQRPFGVNNLVFADVGMPHVLWNLEGGISKKDEHGNLTPANPAKHEEYKKQVTDLVNFLEYIGEPMKLQRQTLGIYVLIFLMILAVMAYILKKEYWRDIH